MIRPHGFFLVAAARAPLTLPVTYFNTVVPRGSLFRLDYILVSYPRVLDGEGDQISGELLFTLHNTRGVVHNMPDLLFRDITTPAGGSTVRAAWGYRIEWPPGAVITMEVRGMLVSGPEEVSITYLGQKGWGKR